MPNYRRARVDGGTYFFTVNTFRRQPFLVDGVGGQVLDRESSTPRAVGWVKQGETRQASHHTLDATGDNFINGEKR